MSAQETVTEEKVISTLAVGHRVWFIEERMPYTVQARNARFVVCTKPFAAQKTVIYTIMDIERWVRGPDNMVFGRGYETREQCDERLAELASGEIEVSHRLSRILPINIAKTQS